jgi:hypothetical protein
MGHVMQQACNQPDVFSAGGATIAAQLAGQMAERAVAHVM